MPYLTRREKNIIVFLIAGAVFGAGYSYYQKYHPPIKLKFRETLQRSPIARDDLDILLNKSKSVSVNTASAQELMKLSGIGPSLANRIVEYRLNNGPFKKKEDIKNVRGIGEKKFDAIKKHIRLE